MLRIGIDIGSDGGIAFFNEHGLIKYSSFPQTEDRPDLKAFIDMFIAELNGHDNIHAVIENLHSIYGSSAASNFSFGWINGAMEAILTTFSIPYTKVQAKKWQKEMWEGLKPVQTIVKKKKPKGEKLPKGEKRKKQPAEPELDEHGNPKYKVDTKATSLLAAKRLFPNETFLATVRSKVPHDGIVDAVLIGEYCKRHF